jgi:serine/threonine-protein kinase
VNRLARALGIVEGALDLDPEAREAHVANAVGGDSTLRAEVDSLLAAHAASGDFLEPPALPVEPEAPREIGPWRLVAPIGAGGMGRVWLAERADGQYEQKVAIKVAAGILGDPDARRRAEAERRILARLEHPSITRVIDGGTTGAGQPYVVMEYVDGVPIDRWCRERRLDPAGRVKLFLDVLDAVAVAHRALVAHRDLKPSNVLVDRSGAARLLDFGIARPLADDARTTVGALAPMTPAYASPEQLAGRPVTTACDVWSLGVMLHELLTGRLPFEAEGASPAAWLASIEARPVTRLAPRIDPARLGLDPDRGAAWRRALRGDLDRIVACALAPEPERRYPSVEAFSADLRRWLANEPVTARAGGIGYRLGKFARRHWLGVSTSAAAIVALAVGLVVTATLAHDARMAAARAEAASAFLGEVISWADPFQSGGETTLRAALERARGDLGDRFAGQPELEAGVRLALARGFVSQQALSDARAEAERALALARPGTPEQADAEVVLASIDWSEGRTDLAASRYRAALAIYRDDPALARRRGIAHNDHSALLNELGDYAAALAEAEAALALSEGIPARELAVRLSNRAYAEDGLGRVAESEASYRQAIALLEAGLPETAMSLSITLNNLGQLLRGSDRQTEALPLMEQALRVRETVLPEGHVAFAIPLANLADLRLEIGQIEAAQSAIARAVRIGDATLASSYAPRGHIHLVAARIAAAAGDAGVARHHAGVALEVYRRTDHPPAARVAEAEALLRTH